MLTKLLEFVCPSLKRVKQLEGIIEYITQIDEEKRVQIQRLTDTLANRKAVLTTTVDKLAVTSHAVHRYRERHKGKGSDEEISKMLYKCLLEQLATMDTLPDGTYDLRKNVKGIISNNTLVTVLPKRDVGKPRL